ncbi:MAG: hypothetical protein VB082_09440 [Christensenella sp.]|nr:hypothetical protein [Christensenella sp.]
MAERIEMRFPAKREYMKAIRLAVSGIACNINYNLDEIEDMKTCVAEACILFLCGQTCDELVLQIECEDGLHVDVHGVGVVPVCGECTDCTGFSEEISRLMIESLSENACFEEEEGILKKISFSKTPAQG